MKTRKRIDDFRAFGGASPDRLVSPTGPSIYRDRSRKPSCTERSKFPRFAKKISCILVFLLAFVSASAENAFEKGIESYHEAAYEEAVNAFETSLQEGETAAAHHNLALALFKSGKPSRSVWHLERAILLDPLNEQYRYKLGALRQQIGLSASAPEWYILASKALSQPAWIILLSLAFWIGLAAFLIPKASAFQVSLPIKAARISSLLALLIAGSAIYLNLPLRNEGIVLAKTPTTLHAAPASAAPQIGLARPGERGEKMDQHGDYVEIKTEGNARGWIHREKFKGMLAPKE